MHNWMISNRKWDIDYSEIIQFHGFFVHSQRGFFKKFLKPEILIGIEGYIIPRNFCFEKYKKWKPHDLIYDLYLEKGMDFIKSIKGVFNIIIVEKKHSLILNDRNGINKFFYFHNDDTFIVSNKLDDIADMFGAVLDKTSAAIFCLMSHFINGMTLFKGISFSGPASLVTCKDKLDVRKYWLPDELLNLEEKPLSFIEIADFWKENIKNYIEHLSPAETTLTLTGGNDSRMVLATLLSLGVKPNTFTFGNPHSLDALIAGKIAFKKELNHNVYHVDDPNPDWLARQGKEIIAEGQSLLNIHRAHRLSAVQGEMRRNSRNEMIIVGDMGGEYIHGFTYTDYITSKLFRLWKNDSNEDNKNLIKTLLKERYFNELEIDVDQVLNIINNQTFIKNKGRFGNFYIEFYLDSAIHHTQDMTLYKNRIKYLIAPFMDIDYLHLLFSSPFHMPLNDGEPKRTYFREIWKPNLRVKITHILDPELSSIEYGKRGYYSARECLGPKVLFLAKRLYRYLLADSMLPNFSYGKWIQDFVKQSSEGFCEETKSLLRWDKYQYDLVNLEHETVEGYWHRFTNWVNIDYILKEYT